MRTALFLLSLLVAMPGFPATPTRSPAANEFKAGRLGTVTVYAPEGPPTSVVLFISGDGGWNKGVVEMAQQLRGWGALVGGVDIRHYLAALRSAGDSCAYPAADFEQLGHALQKRAGLRNYQTPILIGYSSGATLAYAIAAQAPPGTFAAAISLGFCPQLPVGRPWCRGAGLAVTPTADHAGVTFHPAPGLKTPWVVLHGERDQVCSVEATRAFAADTPSAKFVPLPRVGHGYAVMDNWLPQFRDAYLKLVTASTELPVSSAAVSDLPLVEVRATTRPSPRMAILLTGDGGWAGLDREVSSQLSAAGIDVVALSTLRYFWKEQEPEDAARDLARIMRHYLAAWHKDQVLLIGYSFGANVLPFLVSRLPPELRTHVASLSLLAPAIEASFEIHVADWIPGSTPRGRPLKPELARLGDIRTLCLYGDGGQESPCPDLPATAGKSVRLPGDHHFNDDYVTLTREILAFAGH